jgi:hypothetical protein
MDKTTSLLLRIGVALAFLYPPFSALLDPNSWLGYFPVFVSTLGIDETLLLHGFGVVEAILALWILSGKRIFIPSALAAAMLIAIVLFNYAQFDVLFRDVSIALMALALALDARRKKIEKGL